MELPAEGKGDGVPLVFVCRICPLSALPGFSACREFGLSVVAAAPAAVTKGGDDRTRRCSTISEPRGRPSMVASEDWERRSVVPSNWPRASRSAGNLQAKSAPEKGVAEGAPPSSGGPLICRLFPFRRKAPPKFPQSACSSLKIAPLHYGAMRERK